MIRHRLNHKDHGDGFGPEPTLVITVVGIHDVYRLARVMERAQVEFAEIGVATLRGLDRRRPGIVRRLVASMGPDDGYPGVQPRRRE